MNASEVQRLRAAAEKAFGAGQMQEALAHSIRLERADPDEPAWARYTAFICEAMNRTLDQIDALDRAAERYAGRGEILKAAAACKHILALDPEHAATRRRLVSLRAARPRPARPAVKRSPPPTPRVPSGAWSSDGGKGLHALPLRQVVPGARPVVEGHSQGVYAIPLEDDPEASISIQLGPSDTSSLPTGLEAPQVVKTAPSTWGAPAAVAAEDAAVLAVAEELRAAQRTEQALLDTPLFRDMPEDAFHDLLDRAQLVTKPADTDIFRQGADGDVLYVIAQGEVGVIAEGPPRKAICKLGEGDFFGEMALVGDAPRSATCSALTDVELISIDRQTLHGVLKSYPEVLTVLLRFFRDRSIIRVVQTSPLFAGLSARDREIIQPFFRFLEIEPGAVLIRQGARPSGLFVILAGKAEAVVTSGTKDPRADPGASEQRVGMLGPGDVAGEMSLLRDQEANASVRAVDKLFAVEFPAETFQKILRARPAVRAYVERVAQSRASSS